jgi:hypothetical protein
MLFLLHLLHKDKCMCSRTLPSSQSEQVEQKEEREAKKLRTRDPREPRTQPPTLGETILTPIKSKEPTQCPSRRRTNPFSQTKLVLVVMYMEITLMSVLSSLSCVELGKPLRLLNESMPNLSQPSFIVFGFVTKPFPNLRVGDHFYSPPPSLAPVPHPSSNGTY